MQMAARLQKNMTAAGVGNIERKKHIIIIADNGSITMVPVPAL
jgi:hypothetical protein